MTAPTRCRATATWAADAGVSARGCPQRGDVREEVFRGGLRRCPPRALRGCTRRGVHGGRLCCQPHRQGETEAVGSGSGSLKTSHVPRASYLTAPGTSAHSRWTLSGQPGAPAPPPPRHAETQAGPPDRPRRAGGRRRQRRHLARVGGLKHGHNSVGNGHGPAPPRPGLPAVAPGRGTARPRARPQPSAGRVSAVSAAYRVHVAPRALAAARKPLAPRTTRSAQALPPAAGPPLVGLPAEPASAVSAPAVS